MSPLTYQIEVVANSVSETQKIARHIGELLKKPATLALIGDLGSGKTAFVQGLAQGLGVPDNYYVTSPSYTLINEYPGRIRLFHVDIYRLENDIDLEDIGLYDILLGEGVVAIEWADKLAPGCLSDRLELVFDRNTPGCRRIDIIAYGHMPCGLLKNLEKNMG